MILILCVFALFACNNEGTDTTTGDTTIIEQDNTVNKDTAIVRDTSMMNADTMTKKDSIRK
jgi:hypothetical protein